MHELYISCMWWLLFHFTSTFLACACWNNLRCYWLDFCSFGSAGGGDKYIKLRKTILETICCKFKIDLYMELICFTLELEFCALFNQTQFWVLKLRLYIYFTWWVGATELSTSELLSSLWINTSCVQNICLIGFKLHVPLNYFSLNPPWHLTSEEDKG